MELELKYLVERVKDMTALELAVFDEKLTLVAGVAKEEEAKVFSVNSIVSDSVNDRTLFPIKHKGKTFVGRIFGATETEKKFVKLILELATNYFIKERDLTRAEFYRAALLGQLNSTQMHKYLQKFSVEPSPCTAMVIISNSRGEDQVRQIIQNFCGEKESVVKIDDVTCALIKFETSNEEYYSINEFATFLAQSIVEELGEDVKVYLGSTVKSINEISASYTQALSAVHMSKEANAKGNVHSFKEYILIKILEDIPKSKLNEYLEILLDERARTIFTDQEMISTAEEFLDNNLNVSETSRKLYLHRNTLMYRLDKIEKLTGLNLRSFSDAVTFRLITMLIRLIK